MTFSIAIRTIARPQNYLRGTLSRLVETGSLEHPKVLGLHVNHGEGLSPNANGCRALLRAAKDESDWVIFLEDDVDMLDDFIGSVERWLEKFNRPEVRAYPLSCFYSGSMDHFRDVGVWEFPLEKFYGSQGFAIRPWDAIDYANWLLELGSEVSFDIHLGRWHKLVEPDQKFLLTPAPCFLDHLGEFSTLGPPGSWERVGRVESFRRETVFNG